MALPSFWDCPAKKFMTAASILHVALTIHGHPLSTLNHMSLLFLCPTAAMDSKLPGLLRKHNSDLPALSLLGLSHYDFCLKPFILNQPLCLNLHYNLSYLSVIYVLSSPLYYKLWEGKAFVWCICIAVNLQNITMFNAFF